MNREILFKAKRKNWRELPKEEWWVEGNLITNEREEGTAYIGYIFDVHNGVIEDFDIVEVDPRTICQYTGKDDEEGNKIFGHDVISINTYDYNEPAEDYFGEVVYVEAWACWCIQQPREEKPIPLYECEGSYLTEITIEGNAIDNPKLLGGAV